MKKIIISFCAAVMTLSSWAVSHEYTTQHVELADVSLNPGGDYVTVVASVEGISAYTAYGLDIYVPKGFEFVKVELENVDEEMEWMHASNGAACKALHYTQSAIQKDGALRVTASHATNATFKTSSTELFKFYLKANSFVKPGPVEIQIKNCFFTTSAGIQYDTDDITISDKVTVTTSATAPFTVSASNKWSTCILPFDAELPAGVKAYTCNDKDDDAMTLILSSVNSIEAYTPYILYSENGFSGNLTGTVDMSKYPETGYAEEGLLCGAVKEQEISAGYVMQNLDGTGAKFYSMGGDNFIIPAGKCWVKFFFNSNAKMFSFAIHEEDNATAVNAISINKRIANTKRNIVGQTVTENYKGIVIIDGKKYIKK